PGRPVRPSAPAPASRYRMPTPLLRPPSRPAPSATPSTASIPKDCATAWLDEPSLTEEDAMMPTMRAVVLRQFGPPENLAVEEVAAPSPDRLRPGEALVRVESVGVCYHDLINRSGNLPRTKLPC